MRHSGELIKWDDGRGFGFIRTPESSQDLFVHVKAIRQSYTRPRVGDQLSFTIGHGRNGQPAALDVDIAGANPRSRQASQRGLPPPAVHRKTSRAWTAAALLALLIIDIALDRAPSWLGGLYLLVGLGSALLYRADKRAAIAQRWRTPEDLLHTLDLGFGIVGGLLAQFGLRHKTSKPRFAAITWVIVGVHALLLVVLLVGVADVGPVTGVLGQVLSIF